MLVLDTHILYWWANQTADKLHKHHVDAIECADSLAISAMTCWEMAWLVGHGRIELPISVDSWLDHVEASGVMVIPVSRNIALRATQLPEHHKDPIDRLVIATALEHNARLISLDTRFPDYAELNALLVRP